jgi:dipeptidyl aminopeptidase/acylaminoacyl peptidase
VFLAAAATVLSCAAQTAAPAPPAQPQAPGINHRLDSVERRVDTMNWYIRLADIAEVDQVSYTSLPPANEPNPTAQGAGNPLIINALTFIPKKLDRSRKHPFIVFAHGGVHSNFGTGYMHIVRELLEQGYAIIAPDYRGSTGFGSEFYNQIDYGGREVDDVFAAREWMVERYPFVDGGRAGIIGWSHGGLISLMNIFQHPQAFAAAYAGVPVSDLVARMGYKSNEYRAIFSARNHIGKTAEDNVREYLRRSPVTHASKLATPLLIHTTTNDEDVNVLEVERLIAALKAAGKKFEYKIYQDAPGGHAFNRLDTKLARESRQEIYNFLAQHLKPGK